MTKLITDFVNRLQAEVMIDETMVVKRNSRYFLLNKNLQRFVGKDFFYAGVCLGKEKGATFFPSFKLLAMAARGKANKIIVDHNTEWLFICGRDIFRRGIVKAAGSRKRGDYTLVLNQRGECIGFGRIQGDLSRCGEKEVAVKNISDVGDFLRRERRRI